MSVRPNRLSSKANDIGCDILDVYSACGGSKIFIGLISAGNIQLFAVVVFQPIQPCDTNCEENSQADQKYGH